MNPRSAFLAFLAAACMCVLYESDRIVPLPISLGLFASVVAWGFARVRLSRLSLLARLMLVLYALPFIHCFPYLWFDYTPQPRMWGNVSNPYQFDPEIINRLAMVACIGACAFVAGLSLFAPRGRPKPLPPDAEPTLDYAAFLLVAGVALFFTWLQAPTQTVLEVAYGQAVPTPLGNIRFSGAATIAFIFMVLLYIDALHETRLDLRRAKMRVTWVAFALIVVYFSLLRGDRDCIGMIFAFLILYLIDESRARRQQEYAAGPLRAKLWRVALWGGVAFVANQVTGGIRSQVVGYGLWEALSSADISVERLATGTWSGVLLSPLSVVGDFYNGLMEQRWGQTYWHYFLSLPPGPLTQLFGFERPIESTHGPAWEMRYGVGGTHAVVVPFINFKTYGVLLVLFLYGTFIAWLERKLEAAPGTKSKLLYCSIVVGSPFWFWYGEMALVRTLMAFWGVWVVYGMPPKTEHRARRHATAGRSTVPPSVARPGIRPEDS